MYYGSVSEAGPQPNLDTELMKKFSSLKYDVCWMCNETSSHMNYIKLNQKEH